MTSGSAPSLGEPAELVELSDDPDKLNIAFAERGWSDGLSLIHI